MTASAPNLLLICSDQHAARVTGAYGDGIVETPNLDALAAEGCRFDACYCNDPICVPSRASFMTGRYPFRCDVLGNQDVLDSRYPTLAHVAVRGGYHAVLSGKMHFIGPDQRHGYVERLVGEVGSHAVYGGANVADPDLSTGLLGNCSQPAALHQVGAGGSAYVDYYRAVAESCIEWLQRYQATQGPRPPFFLTAGFLLPHCPYIAPEELVRKYEGRVRAPRLSSETLDALHPHHRAYRRFIGLDGVPSENFDKAAVAYYALVDQLDRNVGMLLQELRRLGLWDNTVVVYFSDHGEMLGRHGRWHKDCFHEDSARVPLIVRHPAAKLPASVATPVSLVDLMPTLCDWVGVAAPAGLDGTTLLPLLTGDTRAPAHPPVKAEEYAYWDYGDWSVTASRMVRSGDWKFCCYGAHEPCELFNLANDPEEEHNLADDPAQAARVRELMALLFDDGWSRDVARELGRRLDAIGHRENVREFAKALKHDTLRVDAPDYWPGMARARTWLAADQPSPPTAPPRSESGPKRVPHVG